MRNPSFHFPDLSVKNGGVVDKFSHFSTWEGKIKRF